MKPAYRSYIGSIHQVKIMIKTADGKRGRLFIFDRGTVQFQRRTPVHPYDVGHCLVGCGHGVRRDGIQKRRGVSSRPSAAGKMKLDGMAFFAQWFNDGVKLVM